jgi:hypothetical protein
VPEQLNLFEGKLWDQLTKQRLRKTALKSRKYPQTKTNTSNSVVVNERLTNLFGAKTLQVSF